MPFGSCCTGGEIDSATVLAVMDVPDTVVPGVVARRLPIGWRVLHEALWPAVAALQVEQHIFPVVPGDRRVLTGFIMQDPVAVSFLGAAAILMEDDDRGGAIGPIGGLTLLK